MDLELAANYIRESTTLQRNYMVVFDLRPLQEGGGDAIERLI
jgi:hypothetical protein